MLSGWHMSTRIHLLYEEIHRSRQIANKKIKIKIKKKIKKKKKKRNIRQETINT